MVCISIIRFYKLAEVFKLVSDIYMKSRRVTFKLEPEVKEFYRDDIVYEESSEDILLYLLGAIFVTFVVIKLK